MRLLGLIGTSLRICLCVWVCGRPACARPCYNTAAPPARRLNWATAAPSYMLDASPSPPRARPLNQKEQDILNPVGWREDSPHHGCKTLLRRQDLVTLEPTTLPHITHRQHVRGHLRQMAQETIPLKLHTSHFCALGAWVGEHPKSPTFIARTTLNPKPTPKP